MNNKNRRCVCMKFLHISIFILLQCCTLWFLSGTSFQTNWDIIVSIIALVLLVFQMIGFYVMKESLLGFRFWFLSLTYLFMFGIVFLLAFGYEEAVFWDLHKQFSKDVLFKAGFCVLNYLQALYLGMILFSGRKKSKIYSSVIVKDERKMERNIFITGVILFCSTIPFRLMNDYTLIVSVKQTKNYFKISSNSGIADDIAFLFVPAVIYIISSKYLKKFSNIIFALLICIYFSVIMILTGDRRYCITAIIAIFLCLLKTYDFKLNIFKILLFSGIGVFLLNTLTVIRNIRKGHLLSLTGFFMQNFKNIFIPNNLLKTTIAETMAEFGISFFSVVQVMKNIPNTINFQFGMGFFGAIPTILPIGWLAPEFFDRVSIAGYINTLEKRPVGETIIGDFYANFGFFYLIVSFAFGYLISYIFSFECTQNKKLSIARHYALFYIEINLIRACFLEVFRNSIMIYVIPVCILYFLKRRWSNTQV